jgi:membrane protein DedA with SNARE-associated domain
VFPLALAAATVGALGHALLIYALARWGGRSLLMRGCVLLRIDQRRIDRANARFAHHGGRIVLFGRMMSLVRWLVGIPAGAARMPLRRYVPLTAAGCMVWNSALLGAGWALGSNHGKAGHIAPFVSLALITLVILAVVFVKLRRRRSHDSDNPLPKAPAGSGAGVSVLRRQPHGFEGSGLVPVKPPVH